MNGRRGCVERKSGSRTLSPLHVAAEGRAAPRAGGIAEFLPTNAPDRQVTPLPPTSRRLPLKGFYFFKKIKPNKSPYTKLLTPRDEGEDLGGEGGLCIPLLASPTPKAVPEGILAAGLKHRKGYSPAKGAAESEKSGREAERTPVALPLLVPAPSRPHARGAGTAVSQPLSQPRRRSSHPGGGGVLLNSGISRWGERQRNKRNRQTRERG